MKVTQDTQHFEPIKIMIESQNEFQALLIVITHVLNCKDSILNDNKQEYKALRDIIIDLDSKLFQLQVPRSVLTDKFKSKT